MSAVITYSEDTPEWIKDWTRWTAEMLLPQWEISVTMVDHLEETKETEDFAPDRPGESQIYSENLICEVKLLRTITDTPTHHVEVVHELCHAFLSQMGDAAKNLISSKVVKNTAWKSYGAAEEIAVVILSRLLVSLRSSQVVDKKEIA
jgi:hypothetical protein